MDAIVYDKIGKEHELTRDAILGMYPQKTIENAAIASFDDGSDGMPVKSLIANIEPVQDLHGYENPWPAGGGKNLLQNTRPVGSSVVNGVTFDVKDNGTVTANGTANADILYNIGTVVSKGGNYALNGCPVGGSLETYRLFATQAGSDVGDGISRPVEENLEILVRINIKSGVTVNNLLFKPMIRLATETDATFAPYENIAPISGWTGLNLANIDDADKVKYFNGLLDGTYGFVDLGTLTYNIWAGDSGSHTFSVNYPPKANNKNIVCTKYTTLMTNSPAWASVLPHDKVIFTPDTTILLIRDTTYADAATFKAAMSGVMLIYELATPTTPTITPAQFNTLLETFGLSGFDIHVDWQTEADTVYGGYVDLTKGELVVDRAGVKIKDLTWAYQSQYPRFYSSSIANSVMQDISVINAKTQSEALKFYPWPGLSYTKYGISIASSGNVFIAYPEATTVEELNSAVGESMLIYPLAEPQPYTIDPVTLATLKGQNNIWADTGDIKSLTYRADLAKYLEQKINLAIASTLNA